MVVIPGGSAPVGAQSRIVGIERQSRMYPAERSTRPAISGPNWLRIVRSIAAGSGNEASMSATEPSISDACALTTMLLWKPCIEKVWPGVINPWTLKGAAIIR